MSVAQASRLVGGQTQVPPVSETTDELTAIMYAIAKKVARPARISVKKKDPSRERCYRNAISLRCIDTAKGNANMTGSLESEVPAKCRFGNCLVSLVNPTHLA